MKPPPTFVDLAMPFPLFEAPVADAANFKRSGSCSVCGARSVPVFKTGDDVVSCYACLRAGKAPWTKDTEFGFVDAEHAAKGMTHGTNTPPWPALGYEVVPHPEDPSARGQRYYSVRIALEHLAELLRTPTYSTWQGEQWQFCCHRPAIFLGAWGIDDWRRAAEERAVAVIELLREALDIDERFATEISTYLGDGDESLCTYVFRCGSCGRLRGHHDSD